MSDSSTTETTTIEKLPLSRRKMRVKGSPNDVKETLQSALREVNKSVTLPGFRKGKAPEKLIEQQYPEAIQKAWRDETTQALLKKGLQEAKVTPLFNRVQRPTLQNLSKEDGALLEVEFEVEPESPQISLEGFSLKPIESPEAESAEEALETLKTFHGEGKDITDRPTEEGDLVDLDIELLGDHPMEVSRGKTFFLNQKRLSPWLYQALIGKTLHTPFEATGEGLDGSIGGEGAKHFQITIQAIRKMDPHAEDDAFWKKLGVESKEKFFERFQKEHERQVAEFSQNQKRFQLTEFLKDKYSVELPQGLIDYEAEIIMRNTVHDLLRQGVTEEWIKNNAANLRKEAEKIGADRLMSIYLMLRTAKDKNIQVLIAELQKEKLIEEMVRPVKERILLPDMNDKEKENRLYFEIVTQKTLDQLIREIEAS